MLNKIILIIVVLVLVGQSVFTQNDTQTLEERIKKGDIVLSAARSAIYGDKIEPKIESIKLTTSGEITEKFQYSVNNRDPVIAERSQKSKKMYLLSFPQLARVETWIQSNSSGKETKSEIVIVADGDNFDIKSDFFIDGQKNYTGNIDDTMKNIERKSGGQNVNIKGTTVIRDVKGEVFPFLLDPLFNEGLRFKYIGKSTINGKLTNVVEAVFDKTIASNISIKKRYFFDFATHLLIMSTYDNSNEMSETKSRIFYSDYKKIAGILIPTKVKTEQIDTIKNALKVAGMNVQNPIRYQVQDMVVSEFAINPIIDNKMFKLNKKKN